MSATSKWMGISSRYQARVAARLLRGLAPGDVLLLHDGSALTDAGNRVTLEALPRVLDGLAARGLRSVPLGGTS